MERSRLPTLATASARRIGSRSFLVAVCAALAIAAQAVSTLHIRVVLTDSDGRPMPVPRHALLISDNPTSAAPRRVITGVDGAIDVKLKPGNYTVESDEPVRYRGRAFQWTRILDIVAGRDATLELTAANADAETAGAAGTSSNPPLEAEPSLLLPRWETSVFSVWTPTARVSGFLFDARGLVATNQRAIGTATTAEVQLTPSIKVAARVLASDAAHDVAVLWIDPDVVKSTKPVPLNCTSPKTAAEREDVFAIGVPLRHETDITSGRTSDLVMTYGTDGGPVFSADGGLVGLTAPGEADKDNGRRASTAHFVKTADICEVVKSADMKMTGAPPSAAHLPIEPAWPLPVDAFKNAAEHRVGSLAPYQMSTATFDVAFITPIMIYGAQYQAEQMSRRRTSRDGRTIEIDPVLVKPVMDFGNWFEYLEDFPSVLLVRVTPKQVEGLWTKVARGAAMTQGAVLPPMTRAKSGFLRLRAYCGDTEVIPIHPFTVEHRLSDTEAGYEGLYVFDPRAFAPACPSVKLVVYAEKTPDKPEASLVDPRILQQIAQDFDLYGKR
jgi:hypothetical protein